MTYQSLAVVLSSLVLCTLAGGCSSEYEASGVQSFCVEPVSGPDGPELEVSVVVNACLSSSCDTLVASSCGATEVDGVLQLEATATIESKGNNCTADCVGVEATCTIPVEEGEVYVLRDDDGDEVQVEVGVDEGACSVEPI